MPDNTEHKTVETPDEFLIPTPELEGLDLDGLDLDEVIPTMSVDPAPMQSDKQCIVEDSTLLGLYDEIVDNCRKDRERVEQIQVTFEDMVNNDGDASSASKEAIVNLMKIKTDINDKMAKVADLMTRIHLKDTNTFKPYLSVPGKQVNNKKEILQALQEKRRKEAAGG